MFEGPADAVEALIAFVRGGPGHAEVTSVDVTEEEPEGAPRLQNLLSDRVRVDLRSFRRGRLVAWSAWKPPPRFANRACTS